MHNVKKSFKRLLAVSLCASCVLSNGMLSLAEGAEDKAVNLALGCQATANAQYNQNGNDMSASKAVDGNDETRGGLLKVRPRDGCKWTWENKSPLRSSAS